MKTTTAFCRIVFFCTILIFSSTKVFSQTQLLDDFQRGATSNVVGNSWTEVESAATASIIKIDNDGTNYYVKMTSTSTAAKEYMWRDVSTYYNTVLNTNTNLLVWQFKMRISKSDPTGFDATGVGDAFILGGTSSTFTTGNGYAVVEGESGSTDRVRLVRYTNGMGANANLTLLTQGTADVENDYLAIKVTYNPTNGQWMMYEDDDGSHFVDASFVGITQIGATITDNLYTGSNLKYVGCYFQHGTSTSDQASFDEISVPVSLKNYYSKSTGDLNLLSTWGLNGDGNGLNPPNFTTGGQIFNVRNRTTATISAAWTIPASSGSNVILGDGITGVAFTIPSGFAYSGPIDVNTNSTLTIQNATVPTIGTIAFPSTVDYASTATQTILPRNYYNLYCSSTGGRVWSSGTTGIMNVFLPGANAFVIGNGTVDFMSTGTQTVPAVAYEGITNSGNGPRILSPTGIIEIGGDMVASTGLYTVTGSTIKRSSGSDKTIPVLNTGGGPNYGTLWISGDAEYTIEGAITIGGDLHLSNGRFYENKGSTTNNLTINGNLIMDGGAFRLSSGAGAGILTLKGDFSQLVSGHIDATGSVPGTVRFAGTGIQIFTQNNTDAIESCYITVMSGATVKLASKVRLYRSTNLYEQSRWTIAAGGTVDCGTFQFEGRSSGSGPTYFNIDAGGTLITANALGVYEAATGSVTNVNGVTTTFANGANYVFNGAVTQVTNIPNPIIHNLTISNLTNVSLNSNITLDSLFFTNGRLRTTSTYKVSQTANGSTVGAGPSNYVFGTFEKFIKAAATTRTFEIGDSLNYAPATLTFGGTTNGTGSITATTTKTDYPSLPGSGINPAKTANRYWTLTNNGVTGFAPLGTTFTFINPGDLDATANPLAFVTRRILGGIWYAQTTTGATSTTNSTTGFQDFGSFQVGETTGPPTVVCPATITQNIFIGCSSVVNFAATTGGNPSPSLSYSQNPGTTFPVGTTPVTATVTNINGSANCTFNVIVKDIAAPTLNNCPSNITQFASASSCDTIVTWTPPTATDNCSAVVTSNKSPNTAFPVGVTSVVYTATDPSNNSSTCSFTVTVIDNIAPVIQNCPANVSVNTSGSCTQTATWTAPTVTDNCAVTMVSNHTSGETFPVGTTQIIYTATDASNNISTCSFNVVVTDNEVPFITCPASISVNNEVHVCGAHVTYNVTSTDNCSSTIVSTPASGSLFPIGVTTVNSLATDPSGNTSMCSFTVTVADNELPVVVCPHDTTINTDASMCTAVFSFNSTVTDNCSASVVSSPLSGSTFAQGTTVVTSTATDINGNISSCTFNVTVADNEAPLISNCPQDISTNVDPGSCEATVTWTEPTASDNCLMGSFVSNHQPNTTFPGGVTVVTYTATDAQGNISTCSFNVTVVDNEPIVINDCPGNITVNTSGSCTQTATWTAPTTNDNCPVTLTSNYNSGDVFPVGVTQVIYTATDVSNNTSTCSFSVTVVDNELPVITCPGDITKTTDAGICGAVVTFSPSATDNCSATIVSVPASGSTFPVGTTSVFSTATDPSGNSSNCSFNVIVTDNELPVITNCPSNVDVNTNGGCSQIATWTAPTASDNCSVTLGSDYVSGATFPIGATTVTYTATDASNNATTCSFTVNVHNNNGSTNSVTSCDSYLWNGTTYTSSGTYNYVTTNVAGCDSTATLVLTINYSTTSTQSITACDSYEWNGTTYTTSGSYPYHTTNAAGCDSTATLVLTINNSSSSAPVSATACDSYLWNGTTYTASGTYPYHTTNAAGCDSTATLILTINNSTTSTQSATACDSYTWNGTTYTSSGSYPYHSTNSVGCDSTATLVLTINNSTTSTQSVTACDSYEWNGTFYTTSGSYPYHTTNAAGCDSTATLVLTVNYSSSSAPVSATSCDSYDWNGTTYTVSGTYPYHTLNAAGCDSTATLVLTINNSTTSTQSATACDSYTWNGTTYTSSGSYPYHTTNSVGCDSTATLVLTINYSSTSTQSITACDSYTWNGNTYTTSGSYPYHTTNAAGCDSTATLVLTINYSSSSAPVSATSCDSYLWNGTTYTSSGTYPYHTLNAAGCDSTATLVLTINNSTTSTQSATACDSYSWNGTTYTSSGSYPYHTTNSVGCDSTATLVLTINYSSTSTQSITACDSYTWNGNTYTTSGSYPYHTTNAAGCDSTATLVLTINYSSSSAPVSATSCDSYVWNGTTYTSSGTYPYHTLNAAGCDSTATLVLTINNSSSSAPVSATACDSYLWNGTTYTSSGTYPYHTTNSVGCDSTATLVLTINYSTTSTQSITACDSYTWNGTTYTASGSYPYHTTNAAGCDSTATLVLTINNSSSSAPVSATACDSYEWNGTMYTTSGSYPYHTTNAAGCDSTATLVLTINNSSSSAPVSATACDSYLWNGTTYSASGTYPYHTTNSVGCDSTATLVLTINNSTTSTQSATACDSYTWNGTTYTTSGSYPYHTTNAAGCDSTATLVLTINHSTTSSSTVSECKSYTWNGNIYFNSGTFTFDTVNAAGCDSLATLYLTIRNESTSNQSVTACDSYTWNGTTYSVSGDYQYLTVNSVGCDSTAFLHLTINNSGTSMETASACDSYTWNGTTYTTSGTYTYHTTNPLGCILIATLNLTIRHSSSSTSTAVACDSYTWNNHTYNASGSYTYVVNNAEGCDSTATLNLTINHSNTSLQTVTTCDSYTWNGTTYTTSGSYPYHTSNDAGCDSTATLVLTINYSSSSSSDVLSCTAYTLPWGATASVTGAYPHTYASANGCDSVVTINVTIDDTEAPVITNCPADVTVNAAPGMTTAAVSWTPPTVSDNCSFTLTSNFMPGDIFPSGTTTVTYSAVDGFNNTTLCSFDVTVTPSAVLTMSLKMYLQGYYLGGGTMASVLLNQGVANANDQQTDTVHIELRDANDPSLVIDTASGILMINGDLNVSFAAASANVPYYLVIKHRNTLQTWASSAISLSTTLANSWDFTSAASQAMSSNEIDALADGVFSMYTGDLNQDESIDPFDFPEYDADNLNGVFGTYSATDFNGDGSVDPFDFPVFDANNLNGVYSIHP